MGRVLAIDYGKKKVGLAVTDPLILSSRILPFQAETNIRRWLLEYFKTEEVKTIVIGYPEHADGTLTDLTSDIDKLIAFIEKENKDIRLIKAEECFSTKEAMTLMINAGVSKKKRREKGLIDSYSALVILKDYLRNI